MVQRPIGLNGFEFAVVSALRVRQLLQGCTPRVTCGAKVTVTAQMEVAAGKVVRDYPAAPSRIAQPVD